MLLRLITTLPLIVLAAAMMGDPDRLVKSIERASTGLTSMWLQPLPAWRQTRTKRPISAAGAWYVRCCGILLAAAVALMITE